MRIMSLTSLFAVLAVSLLSAAWALSTDVVLALAFDEDQRTVARDLSSVGNRVLYTQNESRGDHQMNKSLLKVPQWTTGSRLLKLGEGIAFNFFLPDGIKTEMDAGRGRTSD
jgi:hypothetical protein